MDDWMMLLCAALSHNITHSFCVFLCNERDELLVLVDECEILRCACACCCACVMLRSELPRDDDLVSASDGGGAREEATTT